MREEATSSEQVVREAEVARWRGHEGGEAYFMNVEPLLWRHETEAEQSKVLDNIEPKVDPDDQPISGREREPFFEVLCVQESEEEPRGRVKPYASLPNVLLRNEASNGSGDRRGEIGNIAVGPCWVLLDTRQESVSLGGLQSKPVK